MKQNNVKLELFACGSICFCSTMVLEHDKIDNLDDKSKVRNFQDFRVEKRGILKISVSKSAEFLKFPLRGLKRLRSLRHATVELRTTYES